MLHFVPTRYAILSLKPVVKQQYTVCGSIFAVRLKTSISDMDMFIYSVWSADIFSGIHLFWCHSFTTFKQSKCNVNWLNRKILPQLIDKCQHSLSFKKKWCICNTIKDLNLVLNHDPSHYFNINMTENIKFLTLL